MKIIIIIWSIRTIVIILIVIHNVSTDPSFGFLKMFRVELGSLQGTSNQTLYLIYRGKLF